MKNLEKRKLFTESQSNSHQFPNESQLKLAAEVSSVSSSSPVSSQLPSEVFLNEPASQCSLACQSRSII